MNLHMEHIATPFYQSVCVCFLDDAKTESSPTSTEITHNYVMNFYVYQNYFYFNIARLKTGIWYLWMYFLGTKNDAKFWYTILLSNDDNETEEVMTWKKKVVSIEIPLEDIYSSKMAQAIQLQDSVVRNFIKQNAFSINIQLTNPNEENMKGSNKDTSAINPETEEIEDSKTCLQIKNTNNATLINPPFY